MWSGGGWKVRNNSQCIGFITDTETDRIVWIEILYDYKFNHFIFLETIASLILGIELESHGFSLYICDN